MRSTTRLLAASLAVLLAACGEKPSPSAHEHAHEAASGEPPFRPPELSDRGGRTASFVNGDFEGGSLAGWTTATYLNPGLAVASPTQRSQLNLAAGGLARTSVKTAPTESLLASGVGATATLKIPKYGSNAVVVNELGNNRNVNGIRQSMVVTNEDVDPNDNKVHVRFALAPVLENPGHTATQQPYFWITLTNVTRANAVLFYTFNYANQAGVPWKTTTNPANGNAVLYTDWRAFDISPGAAQLSVGDTVELEIIAGGCSLGGHLGQVYLDGIAAYLPGLGVIASAPASVNTGSTLTYTYRYSNNGIDAAPSTVVTAVLPAGTTFASINAPGATCTTPAVGATGTVTCNVGTVNPASQGSFTLTVNVTAASGATISNGNYNVTAASVSAIIGPLVTTSVTSGTTYVDLATTATDGVAAVSWGATTSYTVVVRNNGPSTATNAPVAVPIPANVSAFTGWTCTASGGASCGAASGAGAIATTATLPSGGQVSYAITAAVAAGSGASTISLQATATAPGGTTDNTPSNNVAVDFDQVGTLRTLTVTKAGTGVGTILSSPAAISCGTACASQSAVFLDGTSVVLTASTAAGNRFMTWTAGPCAGSAAPTCTVPTAADTTVTADFMAGDWLVTGTAPGGGGTVTCQSPRLAGQSSTCTITPAAQHRLTALTDDGANVLGSVAGGAYAIASVTFDHTVVGTFAPNTSSTALAAAPASPSAFGQAVTFTATVAAVAPAGTPTGTVTFADGATTLCAAAALSGGTATCTTAALAAGAHALTAAYGGDATWAGSTSPGLAYTVDRAGTAIAVAAAPSPSTYGQAVTLTATLSVTGAGAGTPSGTVTFTDGATVLCTAAVTGGTTATCTTSALAAGAHTIGAAYGGDASFLASGTGTASLSVTQATSSVTLATTGSPSVYGTPVTFTATVSGPAGAPGGTVTFADGATVLCGPVVVVAGVATCTTSALTAGSHPVTVTFGGDANHLGAVTGGTQVVTQATPVIGLAAAPDPSVTGQPVLMTVTVGGAGVPPTGTVTITDGVTVLCGGPVALAGGVASCSTAGLAPGAHLLVASYSGDANYAAGTPAGQAQTVDRAPTTVALDVAPATGVYGQPVTLTATVAVPGPGAGSPGGTVQFFDGATLIGTGTVDPITGIATLVIPAGSPLALGNHAFSVSYGGDAAFQGAASAPVPVFPVGQASTLVGLTPSVAPSVFGQPVSFSIDVTAAAPGSGTPTGTVTVTVDGGTPFGLTLLAGHASFSTAALPVGSRDVSVSYGGDTNFLSSTGSLTQVVGQAATAVALANAPTPSTYGGAVTLTATVTVTAPGAGAPSGGVTFTDGAATLCGGPVALAAGRATCVVSTLLVGTRSLVATYGGDASFAGAASPARTQDVGKVAPTVVVTSTGSPSAYGSPVTFTATVSGPGVTPTGTITFTDGALTPCGPSLALVGGQASCTTSATLPGNHFLTGTYGGDDNHLAASGSVPHFVNPATPTVVASASPSPATFGGAVTLSATVSGPGALPTGSVQFTEGATTLCFATLDAAAVAACASSPLAAGPHAITAQYLGDANYDPRASGFALTVDQAPVTVVLAPSQNPSSYAAATTFTATVTGPGGTPGGQVTFLDGATVLCGGPQTLSAGGTATCLLSGASGLAGGPHTLTASYGGAPNYLPGTSAPLAQQVNQVAPAVALASSSPSSIYGTPVTFTATLSGAGVTPTGTVTFTNGATTLCGPVAAVAGSATCTVSSLLRGVHTIAAAYGGDANYLGGSATRAQSVTPATPAITILSSPSPSLFGQVVTLTVGVSGPGLVPTGTVTISDGVTPLCGGPLALDASGGASCQVASLAAGDHLLVAAYGGDLNYASGSPAGRNHAVQRAPTDLALDVTPVSTVFGEPLTFTATVTVPPPGAGLPGGTVEFLDGTTPIGSAAVDPVTGVATFTLPAGHPLAAGDHAFTATYPGDLSFQGSISPAIPAHAIGQASTLVTVTPSSAPSVYGELVTYTFEVLPVAPGAGTPSGTITVSVDAALTFDLPLVDGVATWQDLSLPVGPHGLRVDYAGDASFLPSGTDHVQVVQRASTAVAVTGIPAPTVFGQPATFTATVTAVAPGSGTPSGTVRLLEGATVLGSGPLDAGGQASFVVGSLPVGSHALTVEYLGDASYAAGIGALDHLVQQAVADVVLTASTASAVYGAPVTFSVAVTPAFLGMGAPTGTVVLRDGAGILGALTLDLFGRGSLTTSTLAPGLHAVVASYQGDASYVAGDSTAAAVTIRTAAATVSLAVAPNPSAFGEPVGWAIRVLPVAPSVEIPDGAVQLVEGATVLETLPLDATGFATGGSAALPVGSHVLTARFAATARFDGADSAPVTQVVEQAPVTVALGASPSPSSFGAPVTFVASVSAQLPGAGLPGGLVSFSDGGQLLGTGVLDAVGEARLTTSALSTGSHTVVASYAGDASFLPRSSLPFTQVVSAAGTAAVATVTPPSSVYGQPVAFGVTVTSTAGVPAGRVDFLEGGNPLGSATLDAAGQATFTTAALAVGSHPVVASYAGSTDHGPTAAAAVTATVLPAATTTALAAAPAAPVAGQPITLTATVLPVAPGAGSPGGLVTFSDGATVLGSAPLDAVTRQATLALASLAPGAHALTASYPGDARFSGSAAAAPLALTVGQAGVAVAVSTSPAASVTGEPVTITVTVTAAAPGAGTPTGQVDLADGATPLGSVTLAGGTGQLVATLDVGSRTLAASYPGDLAFLPGTGSHLHLVGQAVTDTLLTTSGSPSIYGQPVTLTAVVRPVAPGAGSPGGIVTFRDGPVVLGTQPVGPGGVATLATTLDAGLRALSADYGGSAAFAPSRGTAAQDVQRAAVAVAVMASPSPAQYGEPVSVSVTVTSPGPVTPAGTVTLLDGATVVGGPVPLDASGHATFPLGTPSAGVHQLTASFTPAAGFTAGTGATSLTVTEAGTGLALASSRNPSRAGRPVTFTATASADHATPAGTVTFKDGQTVLGTAPLVDGVARLTTRSLRKGTHPVTAQLAPSAGFTASSAGLTGGQVVENSAPVAGSGTALLLGPGHALRATAAAARALDQPAGTVELWARADAAQPGAAPTLARLGDATSARWAVGLTPARTSLTVTLGGTTTSVPADLSDGGWHQVALSAGATAVTVLLDGVEVGVVDGPLGSAPGETLTLGEGFAGELDELRVWSSTRSAAAVAADARRPLQGSEPWLLSCWRMDEAEGLELFDAGPARLDLAIGPDPGAGTAATLGPSGAWRHRVAQRERPLAPIDAGYDADGDFLDLAISAAPAHGTATTDHPNLQVGYLGAAGFSGEDQLAFRLTDVEGAVGEFTVDVTVERILTCSADADCSGGDVCASGGCVAPDDLTARSGSCGCTSAGGGALALWSLLALALPLRRRRPAGRPASRRAGGQP